MRVDHRLLRRLRIPIDFPLGGVGFEVGVVHRHQLRTFVCDGGGCAGVAGAGPVSTVFRPARTRGQRSASETTAGGTTTTPFESVEAIIALILAADGFCW